MKLNKLNKKIIPIVLTGFLLVSLFSALTIVKKTDACTCADECAYIGQHQCSGTSGQTCGNYDSDCCYEWSSWNSCDSQCYSCGDGVCNSACGETSSNCSTDCGCLSPSVDIKANGSNGPINVSYQKSITLSWSSENSAGLTLMLFRWTDKLSDRAFATVK